MACLEELLVSTQLCVFSRWCSRWSRAHRTRKTETGQHRFVRVTSRPRAHGFPPASLCPDHFTLWEASDTLPLLVQPSLTSDPISASGSHLLFFSSLKLYLKTESDIGNTSNVSITKVSHINSDNGRFSKNKIIRYCYKISHNAF